MVTQEDGSDKNQVINEAIICTKMAETLRKPAEGKYQYFSVCFLYLKVSDRVSNQWKQVHAGSNVS